MWDWNPQVDQLIDHFSLELGDNEIREIVNISNKYCHDPFVDTYDNPVWWQQIEYRVSKVLRDKINALKMDKEDDMFGWSL